MSGEASRPRRRIVATALVVAVVALILDQVSKTWAVRSLSVDGRRPLIGDLITLQLIRNSGAALSLGSKMTWIFTLVAVVVIIGIGLCLPRIPDLPTACAVGLLGGGAIGNLIDRLVQPPSIGQGHVVDFINYHGLFIGNVADVWIVVGAIWLVGIYVLSDTGRQRTDDTSLSGESGSVDE